LSSPSRRCRRPTSSPTTASRSRWRGRIIVYRRPLLARAENDGELSDLVFDIVVEEFADFLGLEPDSVDPGYRGGLD
jgi:predicted Zn-dependent protease with MMP-like domain